MTVNNTASNDVDVVVPVPPTPPPSKSLIKVPVSEELLEQELPSVALTAVAGSSSFYLDADIMKEEDDDLEDCELAIDDVETSTSPSTHGGDIEEDIEKKEGETNDQTKNKTNKTNSNNKSNVVAKYARVIIFSVAFLFGLIICFTPAIHGGGTNNEASSQKNKTINYTMAIAIWISALWLTELIPLVVTSFLPIFLFPMFGILSNKDLVVWSWLYRWRDGIYRNVFLTRS